MYIYIFFSISTSIYNFPFAGCDTGSSEMMWQKMAVVQTVANKLSSELWQEMAAGLQSPENTIYSASTQVVQGVH